MSTVAQALASVRAAGAKVTPVFYDHEPKRPKRAGGPQWHYSIRVPDETDALALLVRLRARTKRLDLGVTKVSIPPISDGHHVIVYSTSPVGLSITLYTIANLLP